MSDERKMILNMLEDGKITADEAERLLKALNESTENEKTEQQAEDESSQLSEFVDWESWDDRKQTYKQRSSGFKFSQYIENVIQKLKDVDIDLNFGSYENVKHIFQDDSDQFRDVKVKVKNGSVELTPWNNSFVQIDCDVKVYRVNNSDAARHRFLQEARFEIEHETLIFECDARDVKVMATIYVPEKAYESVECKLFNGSVSSQAIKANDLFVKTVNGSITISQLTAQKAEFETGNGTITVQGEVNRLEAETMNGAIEANGTFRDFDAESFSGAITAYLQSDGYVSLKSTTGGITVVVPADVQVNGELVSSIGSVHCELHSFEILREKKELAQRLLKFVSNKKVERMLTLEANTKTGSITVSEREG